MATPVCAPLASRRSQRWSIGSRAAVWIRLCAGRGTAPRGRGRQAKAPETRRVLVNVYFERRGLPGARAGLPFDAVS